MKRRTREELETSEREKSIENTILSQSLNAVLRGPR